MDFTINTYKKLLGSLTTQRYAFQTFADFLEKPEPRSIILRHDVDLRPDYSLRFARIQSELGIMASYYFRTVPGSFDEKIILEIESLDHEIGYHYETMNTARGNVQQAFEEFEKNLAIFRNLVPVKTICMHGSPLSKYDNRDLWKKYNYRDYGITGEPYFDIDFSRVFYLTDTGRRWDGEKVSVRDKVGSSQFAVRSSQAENKIGNWKPGTGNLKLRSTSDIISAAKAGLLPDQVMFTFHPQRWTDDPLPWMRELVMQNVKNVVKRLIIR